MVVLDTFSLLIKNNNGIICMVYVTLYLISELKNILRNAKKNLHIFYRYKKKIDLNTGSTCTLLPKSYIQKSLRCCLSRCLSIPFNTVKAANVHITRSVSPVNKTSIKH